jgi:hypothetical protein
MLQDLMTPTWRNVDLSFGTGNTTITENLTLDSQFGIVVQDVSVRIYANDGTNLNYLAPDLLNNDMFTIAVSGNGGVSYTDNSPVDIYAWAQSLNSSLKPVNLWFMPKSSQYTFAVTHSSKGTTANYTHALYINITISGIQTTANSYVEFLQQQKNFAHKVNEPFIPKR